MALRLPPRWLLCPRRGTLVEDTRFVPFKVPLDSRYDSVVKLEHRFTPGMLLDAFSSDNMTIGMVIDLTKTDRYYDKKEFTDRGVAIVKLECAGHDAVPEPAKVKDFISICNKFWKNHPDKYIGVHCTHGFNRTGYMICSYLVEEYGSSIEAAVDTFVAARQPGIYKEHYLRELFEYYKGDQTLVRVPDLPNWDAPDEPVVPTLTARPAGPAEQSHSFKRQRGDEDDDDADDDHPSKKQVKGLVGVDSVIGSVIGGERAFQVQVLMQTMCGFRGNQRIFPGAQLVSMDLENFDHCILNDPEQEWLVSWKADGTRYLFAIMDNHVYMADRDFRIYLVPGFVFPSRDPSLSLNGTVLDGELVVDEFQENGKLEKRPRFLIFDLVGLRGESKRELTYTDRLKLIESEVIHPREKLKKVDPSRFAQEPFGVRAKLFLPLREFEKMADSIKPKLPHKTDGYVFTPVRHPYMPGSDQKLLKWKPLAENSIDFMLRTESKPAQSGMLPEFIGHLCVKGERNQLVEFSRIYPSDRFPKAKMLELNGKIIECNPVPSMYGRWQWVYHRTREDKSEPNANATADSVCKSLDRGISDEHHLRSKVKQYIERRYPSKPQPPKLQPPQQQK